MRNKIYNVNILKKTVHLNQITVWVRKRSFQSNDSQNATDDLRCIILLEKMSTKSNKKMREKLEEEQKVRIIPVGQNNARSVSTVN